MASFCSMQHVASTYHSHDRGLVGADSGASSSKNFIYKLATTAETGEPMAARHQGIKCCWLIVKYSVWWPGVTKQMPEMIQQCCVCANEGTPRKGPLMVSPLPDHAWQVIGIDLFELKGVTYLLVVDYFSNIQRLLNSPLLYHSIPGKCPWVLYHNSIYFSLPWALTRCAGRLPCA